jgi:1-acyl-sn-glycerol-3-phosphate acyltransferase
MLVITPLTIGYSIVLAIGGKKYAKKCIWVNCHYASPLLLKLFGVKLVVHNPERVNSDKTYVFVSNHGTHIDVLANASACPLPPKFLAKSELKNFPIFGFMVSMLAILVDRKSKESRDKSMRYMVQELTAGNSIFLYPEGTRNRTPQPLKEFKDGAFRAAILAQIPIAIQTIVGARSLNKQGGLHLKPGTVHVYWGKPIETKGLTIEDLPALRELVRNEMIGHLTQQPNL